MRLLFTNIFFILFAFFVVPVQAQELPPELLILQEKEAEGEFDPEEFSVEIRKDAQKEAALSYGARGGLSKRIYEIRQDLDKQTRVLDKVYDFIRMLDAEGYPKAFLELGSVRFEFCSVKKTDDGLQATVNISSRKE